MKVFHEDRKVTHHKGFDPYCFIRDEDLWNVDPAWGKWEKNGVTYGMIRIKKSEGVNFKGQSVAKVTFSAPFCVRQFRDEASVRGLEVYEADIPYHRRWLWDKKVPIGSYKPLYWDIEVDSRTGFQDPARFEGHELGRVISIAGIGSDGVEECFMDSDEKVLIEGFFTWARKHYGCLVGWNTNMFDEPYIMKRSRALGMFSPLYGIESMDLLPLYKRSGSTGSMKLSVVGMRELGFGKVEEFESRARARELYDSFMGDGKSLEEYNIGDCAIVKGVDEKYSFVKGHEDIACIIHSSIGDTPYTSRVVDAAVIQTAMARNPRIVVPGKKFLGSEVGKYQKVSGGYVLDAVRGFWRNVALIDFTSMYPSIIRGFNISPETKNPESSASTVVLAFDLWPDGIFSQALSALLTLRMREKKLKQTGNEAHRRLHKRRDDILKQVVNSFYGVIASPYSRFYEVDVANSVTLTGQHFLGLLRDEVNAYVSEGKRIGHVVYGDTDSLFIALADETEPSSVEAWANAQVKSFVAKIGGNPSLFNIECEYIFDTFVLPGKKKKYYGVTQYVGHKKEKIEVIKGFAARRADTMEIVKQTEKDTFAIIYKNRDEHVAQRECEKYMYKLERDLHAGVYDEKLVMKVHMMMERSAYKANPMHVRAAALLPPDLQLSPGDLVSFTISDLDKAGKPIVVPVLDGDVPTIRKGGYAYIFDHYILPAAKRLFPHLQSGGQRRLEDYVNA